MSDKDSLFEGKEIPKEVLTELVGDGKKYKDVEELARSRIHADIHIAKLEKENSDFREKLAGAKTVQDVLEAVQAASVPGKTAPEEVPTPAQGGLTAEEIATIVREQLTGLESQKTRVTNRQRADAEMRKLFGDKAKDVFNKVASTPELVKIYTELAEVDAEKFISMFKKESTGSVVDSAQGKNVTTFTPVQGDGAEPGTQAFYAQLRKKNPSLYYSASTQLKMHSDALTNPDKYFGRS